MATARVTAIAQGSSQDEDMTINIDKTEVMHVKGQGRVPQATQEEAKKVEFTCELHMWTPPMKSHNIQNHMWSPHVNSTCEYDMTT